VVRLRRHHSLGIVLRRLGYGVIVLDLLLRS
jgi:hypothetical protein